MTQGLVKGAILCFRNPYFYFRHGRSTSTASQLTPPASQKSKDLNKVSLLLQDLDGESSSNYKHKILFLLVHILGKAAKSQISSHLVNQQVTLSSSGPHIVLK